MIRVLLIEDDPRDAQEVKAALSHSGGSYLESFEFSLQDTLQRGLEVLKAQKVDVILLDLDLPDARDFYGLDRLRRDFPRVPLIVLTKQNEETLIALEAVKRGAQDYFSKRYLRESSSLDRVIRYAIERKKVEQDLVAAREEALKASRAKSEFLANISHDIRTPLNCIIGVADLLSRAKLSEEEKNHVQMLTRASDNLLSLINNVLDLSKIEAGQVEIRHREFDLLETVGPALDIVATRAHGKGLELIFKIDPEVPRDLIGATDLVGQVLVNLLGNAVKFTKQGEVSLMIHRVRQDSESVTLQLLVKDTGIGIPQDKLTTIFESFTQLEQDSSLKPQGSGLGLSICRRLVELMKGQISVRSRPGQGSEFQVQLQFALAKGRRPRVVNANLNLTGKKVLVTDDNGAHGTLLKELLELWSAEVHLAKNRQEALALVAKLKGRQQTFDLAVLDLRMPGVATGGIELARDLAGQIGAFVMMLPTNHRHGDLKYLRDLGIDQYYFKPTKPERLAEVVAASLRGGPKVQGALESVEEDPRRDRLLHLLVADDSEDNRQLIQAYCKGANIQLEMAEDGRQALEKFKHQNFDLVLMDIQMPQMNGYEALAAIRQWERANSRSSIPVLALTAFALKEEAERCLSAGFNAHVTKPITKSDLIKTITRFAV